MRLSQNIDYESDFEKSYTTQENEDMGILNDRQKLILEQEGLPTDFNSLTESQQYAIKRIDELLTYLENKYNETFHYVGYASKSALEDEWLKAYPDELNEYYYVTLYVTEEGSISDNYLDMVSKCLLEMYVSDYLNETFMTSFKVYSLECKYNGINAPNDITDFENKTSLTVNVFVKGKNKSEDLYTYAKKIAEWYGNHKISGYVNLIMVSEDYFDNITVNNFKETLIKDNTEISLSCDIYESGNYKIY